MLTYKKHILIYTCVVIAFFATGLYISGFIALENEKQTVRSQIVMGTIAEIKIIDENEENSSVAIKSAFEEIKRIEELFSTYRPESSVSEINHSGKNKIKLNDEILHFIKICDSLWRVTKGTFDPALGRLTTAWGFNGEMPAVPSKKKLKYALLNSGWQNIEISNISIIKKKNILLDFGSVAKGYAVDRAVGIIKSYGIKEALVNIGGEVKGIGRSWQVGIKHPRVTNLLISKVILNNLGIATSGDYEKYFFENGKRYCHIFNPVEGYPASVCSSVSVVNKSVMIADALATACFVLGPEEGIKLINQIPETECLIIDKTGIEYKSQGFEGFITERKL